MAELQNAHNGLLSDLLAHTREVIQGCLLSPLLFILLPNVGMENDFKGSKRGQQWRLTETREVLDFTDNIAIFSYKLDDKKHKVVELVVKKEKIEPNIRFGSQAAHNNQ